MMPSLLIGSVIVVTALMLPYVARAMIGPTVFDRVMGLNALGTKVAVLMVLIGAMHHRTEMFVDIALALFLLNLVTTLLIARYVHPERQDSRDAFDA